MSSNNEGEEAPTTWSTTSFPNRDKGTTAALEPCVGPREHHERGGTTEVPMEEDLSVGDVGRIPSPEDPLLRLTLCPPSTTTTAYVDEGHSNKEALEKRLLEEGDEEGDESSSGTHKRKKLRLSREQSSYLEDVFRDHTTLTSKQKSALARRLNLRPRQVEVWFQNRRARTKLKQMEVDCELWRQRCLTLSEENRRLSRELYELKLLKIATPFYMHTPPTTLSICNSCDAKSSSISPFAIQTGRY